MSDAIFDWNREPAANKDVTCGVISRLGIILESVQSLKYVPTNVCYTIIRRVIHPNACYWGEGIDDSLVYNMHLSLRCVARFPRPYPIR